MKHIRNFFYILLVKGIYSLKAKTNVNANSPMSISTVPTLLSICNSNETNAITINNTNTGNNNNMCVLCSSETTDDAIDLDVIKNIEYYNNFATRIWRLFPPILLGKIP